MISITDKKGISQDFFWKEPGANLFRKAGMSMDGVLWQETADILKNAYLLCGCLQVLPQRRQQIAELRDKNLLRKGMLF